LAKIILGRSRYFVPAAEVDSGGMALLKHIFPAFPIVFISAVFIVLIAAVSIVYVRQASGGAFAVPLKKFVPP